MKKYIVYNAVADKGAIVDADNVDEARRKAHLEFYGAYAGMYKRDLDCIQVMERGRNHPFSVNGKELNFKKIQFQFIGGVTTSYNCTIYEQPTEKQVAFIGGNEITSIIFFNTDTPQGNWGDKVGNK